MSQVDSEIYLGERRSDGSNWRSSNSTRLDRSYWNAKAKSISSKRNGNPGGGSRMLMKKESFSLKGKELLVALHRFITFKYMLMGTGVSRKVNCKQVEPMIAGLAGSEKKVHSRTVPQAIGHSTWTELYPRKVCWRYGFDRENNKWWNESTRMFVKSPWCNWHCMVCWWMVSFQVDLPFQMSNPTA